MTDVAVGLILNAALTFTQWHGRERSEFIKCSSITKLYPEQQAY